jgi:hypothetical protein
MSACGEEARAMTNDYGRRLMDMRGASEDRGKYSGITLGAYRRGKIVMWIPGATIVVWTACARQDTVTGVPWPHCYFIQTIGVDGGSIHCPSCRSELAAKRQQQNDSPKKGQLSLF